MRYATHTLALTLLLAVGLGALAQPAPEVAPKACPDCAARRKDTDSQPTRTFYLKYAVAPSEMNEIAAALRQLLPDARTFVIPSEDAIMIRAIPEDMALAEKALSDLDRPKKSWRLTYTLTEMDGNNRLGTQHYSMDLVDGQQTTLQQGSRVPLATGSYSAGGGSNIGVQTQFTYQNIGITFDATLSSEAAGARLLSNIDQESIADASNDNLPARVVTRHTSLKGSYLLAPNKPLILGTMDIPGSAHHLEVEALIEPLP